MIEFHNIRIQPTPVPNELIGETDLIYEGGAGITLATEIYINWPKNKVLPSLPPAAVFASPDAAAVGDGAADGVRADQGAGGKDVPVRPTGASEPLQPLLCRTAAPQVRYTDPRWRQERTPHALSFLKKRKKKKKRNTVSPFFCFNVARRY